MRKILLFSLVAGLILLFSGCDHQTDTLLERAESYLPAHPDSAEVCLDSIPQEELSDDQRAMYGLLRTVISNHKGDGVTSDSLIRPSYEYYRKVTDAGMTADLDLLRRYAQSCYYMCAFYTYSDSIDRCGELLQHSIEGSEMCEDWHTCYLAHTLLSLTASYDNPQDATRQALKALEIYHNINDDINNEVLIMGHVAASYLAESETDSALAYYLKGYELAEKHQLREAQNSMCMGLSDTYCYMGAFWQALQYAKMGVETADSTTLVPSLLSLAQCYYASDSLDKAKAVLDTIPCDSDDYLSRYLTLRTLSEIAVQKRNIESLYSYVDSAYLCLEDRFSREQKVKDATVIEEKKQVEVQHETELHRWIGALVFIILLLVAGILFYFYRVRKRRVSPSVEEPDEEIVEDDPDDADDAALVLEQPALPPYDPQQVLAQAQMQQRLVQRLETVHRQSSGDKQQKRVERAWAELENFINEKDHDFVRNLRLQHPDFKEKDIRLCMLVRLKVTNATLINIYQIGESAVKKRKSTLKKQGFHISDPNVTLEQVVENI